MVSALWPLLTQEFATVGPAAFDLGCLIGVLLLAYITLSHQGPTEVTHGPCPGGVTCDMSEGRPAQKEWLVSTLLHFWDHLLDQLQQLHGGKDTQLPAHAPLSASVCADVVGFAATTIIRLTIGMHAYPGYTYVTVSKREACEVQALRLATALITLRCQLQVEVQSGAGGSQEQGVVESLMQHVVGLLPVAGSEEF
jgi:5-methylthioribose kinase